MPLYEYRCEACGEHTEVIRKFSDEPLKICASCNGPLRKLISSPAIQFKGSGFYITDYAKPSSKDSSGEGKEASSSSDKGTAAKPAASKPTSGSSDT